MAASKAPDLTDIDPVSSVPYLHESFILNCFVPMRYVRRQKPFEDATFTGSYADGYKIPTVLTAGKDNTVTKKTSIDDKVVCMMVAKETVGPDNTKKNYTCIAHSENTFPGYLNLVPQTEVKQTREQLRSAPALTRERSNLMLKSEVSTRGTSSRKYLQNQNSMQEANEVVEETEPLTPRSFSAKPSSKPRRKKLPDNVEYELALRFPVWPEVAAEWVGRQRGAGWPGSRLEKKITSSGCHVTPASHPKSADPEIEWMYTFFDAERLLDKDAVSSVQRQCFIAFNLLLMELVEQKRLSYQQLKSAFYFTCEKLDPQLWRSNKALCVNNMLDHLLDGVKQGCLPHYFVSQNNTIGHLEKENIKALEDDLTEIRKHVVNSLLAITDKCALVNIFPFYCNVHELFKPFLEDSVAYTRNKSIEQSVQALLRVTDELSTAFYLDSGFQTYEESFEEVAHYISSLISHSVSGFEEAIEYFIKPLQGDNAAKQHLEYMPQMLSEKNITLSERLPPTEIWRPIRMCRLLIKKFSNGKRGSDLYDHLGCMYHSAAKQFQEHKKETLKRAEAAFKSALEKQDCGIGTYADYGSFLCKTNRYEEAIPVLRKVILAEGKKPSSINFYGKMEAIVADEYIKREIEANEGIELFSVAYCYYLTCECFIHLKKKKDLMQNWRNFEEICLATNDANSFSLLGYTRMKLRQFTKAQRQFETVLKIQPDNKLAYENIAACKKFADRNIDDSDLNLEKKLTKLNLWET